MFRLQPLEPGKGFLPCELEMPHGLLQRGSHGEQEEVVEDVFSEDLQDLVQARRCANLVGVPRGMCEKRMRCVINTQAVQPGVMEGKLRRIREEVEGQPEALEQF